MKTLNFRFRKERAILFHIYYHRRETSEYLRQLVNSSGAGQVKECQPLKSLDRGCAADVILLEYQPDNPSLDRWIARTTAQAQCPDIFLFVPDLAPFIIWKALKFGAQEVFPDKIPPTEFLDAVLRVQARQTGFPGLQPPSESLCAFR